MVTIAYMLYWLGVAIFLIGNLMFLAVAFRSSAIWFLGCLLVPFVDVLYFCVNVRQTWKPFLLTITGFLMSGIGYWLGGFNF